MRDTWLSKLMPEVLAKFLRKSERKIQMYHTVPAIFANSKERAEVFLKHWNYYIGMSEITYARNDSGKIFLQQIRESRLGPDVVMHRKQVFL
jgi:hypothetical protein